MKKDVLTQQEIDAINHNYIHNFDKWHRMFAGLSSHLIRVEEGILYLEITNTQTNILSSYNTAVKFACKWKNYNKEIYDAKGFVVIFMNTNVAQGCFFPANQLADELSEKMMKVLRDMENDSPELGSIYSGIFTKQLESVEQDLTKDN